MDAGHCSNTRGLTFPRHPLWEGAFRENPLLSLLPSRKWTELSGGHFPLAQGTLFLPENVSSFVLETLRASHISHGLHWGWTVNMLAIKNVQKILWFSQRSILVIGIWNYSIYFLATREMLPVDKLIFGLSLLKETSRLCPEATCLKCLHQGSYTMKTKLWKMTPGTIRSVGMEEKCSYFLETLLTTAENCMNHILAAILSRNRGIKLV